MLFGKLDLVYLELIQTTQMSFKKLLSKIMIRFQLIRWSSVYLKADWLKNKILEGRVAIINNVFGSTSRDHPYSTLVWTSGDHDALPQELCRSGWGGRLASI